MPRARARRSRSSPAHPLALALFLAEPGVDAAAAAAAMARVGSASAEISAFSRTMALAAASTLALSGESAGGAARGHRRSWRRRPRIPRRVGGGADGRRARRRGRPRALGRDCRSSRRRATRRGRWRSPRRASRSASPDAAGEALRILARRAIRGRRAAGGGADRSRRWRRVAAPGFFAGAAGSGGRRGADRDGGNRRCRVGRSLGRIWPPRWRPRPRTRRRRRRRRWRWRRWSPRGMATRRWPTGWPRRRSRSGDAEAPPRRRCRRLGARRRPARRHGVRFARAHGWRRRAWAPRSRTAARAAAALAERARMEEVARRPRRGASRAGARRWPPSRRSSPAARALRVAAARTGDSGGDQRRVETEAACLLVPAHRVRALLLAAALALEATPPERERALGLLRAALAVDPAHDAAFERLRALLTEHGRRAGAGGGARRADRGGATIRSRSPRSGWRVPTCWPASSAIGRRRARSWRRSCASSRSTRARSSGCRSCSGAARPGARPARSICGARWSSAIRRRCAGSSCASARSTRAAPPTPSARRPPTSGCSPSTADNLEALRALSDLTVAEGDAKRALPVTERLVAREPDAARRHKTAGPAGRDPDADGRSPARRHASCAARSTRRRATSARSARWRSCSIARAIRPGAARCSIAPSGSCATIWRPARRAADRDAARAGQPARAARAAPRGAGGGPAGAPRSAPARRRGSGRRRGRGAAWPRFVAPRSTSASFRPTSRPGSGSSCGSSGRCCARADRSWRRGWPGTGSRAPIAGRGARRPGRCSTPSRPSWAWGTSTSTSRRCPPRPGPSRCAPSRGARRRSSSARRSRSWVRRRCASRRRARLRLTSTNLDAILAVPPEEAGALLVGIIRQFVPDYQPRRGARQPGGARGGPRRAGDPPQAQAAADAVRGRERRGRSTCRRSITAVRDGANAVGLLAAANLPAALSVILEIAGTIVAGADGAGGGDGRAHAGGYRRQPGGDGSAAVRRLG